MNQSEKGNDVSLIALIVSTVLQVATEQPNVDVQTIGKDQHRVVITGLEEDERVSQAAVAQVAARICGSKTPSFGRFEATRNVTTVAGLVPPAQFAQEVTCVPAVVSPPRGAATQFTPDVEADRSARAAANAFLADYFAGRGSDSRLRMTAGMRDQFSETAWTEQATRQAIAVGLDPRVAITKLTWYVDPPGVLPGVYAAADFTGESAKAVALCGFVALQRDSSGAWKVARIESGTLPRAGAAGLDAARLSALRTQLRCVDS